MELWFVLLSAGITSTLYAGLLSTPLGIRLTLAKTHYTVIFGVAMTLGFVALVDWDAAQLLVWFFLVTGTPIVIRSEVLDYQERRRIEKLLQGDE